MKWKNLFVLGTRPEAIKLLPVIKEFQKHSLECETNVCVTGQHRQMLDQVISLFGVVPEYDFNIMKKNQNIAYVTSSILNKLNSLLHNNRYDFVYIHGDTSTALASGLASFYAKISVVHIEAGLRTYDINTPWPEEMNRQVCDRISSFHFCPTQQNAQNLISEHINREHIVITGNTVIDALLMTKELIYSNPRFQDKIINQLREERYKVNIERKMILITGHRRESFGKGFLNICNAIKELAYKFPEVDFVYPVHLNPNVQKPVYTILGNINNVYLIKPQDYISFVWLMDKCYAILTDSGGIQEEAPSLNKPVFVMRETTERPEALLSGAVKIIGTDEENIKENISKILNDSAYYCSMINKINPYGDGKASQRIYNYMRRYINEYFKN